MEIKMAKRRAVKAHTRKSKPGKGPRQVRRSVRNK